MDNRINICFSWLTSCWKTSHANHIAQKYGIPRVSASDILIKEWKKRWLHTVEHADLDHPWLKSFDGFNQERVLDTATDEKIDREIFDLMQKARGVIVESLTFPFLRHNAGKEEWSLLIYLHASHINRVWRAFNSSPTMTIEDLDKWVRKKDETSKTIIGQLWKTDIQDTNEQFPYNNVVLNTDVIDNGDPFDADNRERGKNVTRMSLISIIDLTLWVQGKALDVLKRISDEHPWLFNKLPANIWTAIQ